MFPFEFLTSPVGSISRIFLDVITVRAVAMDCIVFGGVFFLC